MLKCFFQCWQFVLYTFSTTICPRKKLTEKKYYQDNGVAHNGDYDKDCPAGFMFAGQFLP
uniref:Uncharacterized protein n=1 Tax=Inoviridae sp. ctNqM18 TaxID=2825780 RepID=A0A8S5U228_9VIRU|nr:MAG TPA: hypothetical protein [Inoviridae sp. ctNqM18]